MRAINILSIIAILTMANICFGQSKTYLEIGGSGGIEAVTLNIGIGVNNLETKLGLISGIGINIMGIKGYKAIGRVEGDDSQILLYSGNTIGVEERGPDGFGVGLRLISKYGIGIEGGYMGVWKSRFTKFSVGENNYRYAWERNMYKGYAYARIIAFTNDKFTAGFGISEVEKGAIYLGWHF